MLVLALAATQPALAQPLADESIEPADPREEVEVPEDTELGPVVTIEDITISGNTTQEDVIRRALPIAPGDTLKQSDKRLRDARFKVLSLGYFADVQVAMRKGSQRGRVIIDVTVVERGTFVLNRLWFGHSDFAHYWLGADVGDRNLLGLGVVGGLAMIYASDGEIEPRGQAPEPQWAGEVRLGKERIGGTRWGVMTSLSLVRGSDYYFVDDPTGRHADAFSYRRFGGRLGVSFDATPLTRVTALFRAETITHQLNPFFSEREWLDPGESQVATVGLMLDRDTRPEPILPHRGSRVTVRFELGAKPIYGNDYDFASLLAHYEYWHPVRGGRDAIGIRFDGGIVSDGTPRFDRLFASDINPMLTPRALGLVLSNASPLVSLRDADDMPRISTAGALAAVEYAARLFRGSGKRRVYGGDLFLSVGAWGMSDSGASFDHARPDGTPIDLYVDTGIRVDTDWGIFELTVANALGRLR